MKHTGKKLLTWLTALSLVGGETAVFADATVSGASQTSITVPSGTTLYVGAKPQEQSAYGSNMVDKHYVTFTEQTPTTVTGNTYYYDLEDGKTYNYRVTSDDYITYAGKFTATDEFSLNVTEGMLASDKTKTTVERSTSANGGYNVADIYLNINPQGYLKLDTAGDTYQLIPLRNWEAVDSTINNYFIEPDYHYEVVDVDGNADSSVVTVSDSGLVTAVGNGTAIVLVTYDALNYANGTGGPFFGAIWAENTGVFVVGVGQGESGISANMTINEGRNKDGIKLAGDKIDAEHDVIYFTGNEGKYTFTPSTSDCTVAVANPTVGDKMTFTGFTDVAKNTDNSFSVPLRQGRNIVKIEKDGACEYQIITAKSVTVTVNGGEDVHPGDELSIVFNTLYHPSNKLAGVYNMTATPIYKSDVFSGEVIGGTAGQFTFASNVASQTVSSLLETEENWGQVSYKPKSTLKVPDDYTGETLTLTDGTIYVSGWGDSYGNHRNITLTDGKAPNLDANPKDGVLGTLPDIVIPIVRSSGGGSTENENITVKFSLYGDSNHGTTGATHTLKSGNLEKWITQENITVRKGSTVLTVVEKALAAAGMTYSNPSGNYIESINGLKAGDNGTLSGWLYTLNGKYPNLGASEQSIANGDVIVLHYTDDYTKETVSESFSGGGGSTSVKTDTTKKDVDYASAAKSTAKSLIEGVSSPTVAQTGGEWLILALARGDYEVADGYFAKYYENVCKTLAENDGVLHDTKYTEYARVTLALTAIGENPTDCGGYDLTAPLKDFDKVTAQGMNGPVFALLALDSGNYGDEEICNRYVTHILSMQNSDGGFGVATGTASDVDMTAMTLTALANYRSDDAVAKAIDKALEYISKQQNNSGTFGGTTSASAESNAQVLTAMSALGIDVNDSRFVKKNKTVLDGLMSFYIDGKGFSHTAGSKTVNAMATEQALYSLAAYDRAVNGRNALYDMSDVTAQGVAKPEFGLTGKHEDVVLMPIIMDGEIFTDIAESPYKTAIEALASRGIVDGKNDGEFEPQSTMTRAEFAAITVRALGLPVGSEKIFGDVSEGDWYFDFVATAYKYGIIDGVSDTEFNPNGTITRAETATMLTRVAKLCGNATDMNEGKKNDVLAQFDDYLTVPEWAATAVAWCVDGDVLPSDELEIEVNEHIMREESAYMLYRVMELSKLV